MLVRWCCRTGACRSMGGPVASGRGCQRVAAGGVGWSAGGERRVASASRAASCGRHVMGFGQLRAVAQGGRRMECSSGVRCAAAERRAVGRCDTARLLRQMVFGRWRASLEDIATFAWVLLRWEIFPPLHWMQPSLRDDFREATCPARTKIRRPPLGGVLTPPLGSPLKMEIHSCG